MITHASVFAAALLSVTFGYEPSQDADQGYDYIVQVEPERLEEMHSGKAGDIEVNIPREVNPVRRIRIVVGEDELPRKLRPPQTRAAMRPDVDAGGTLLAQTGPGFGRSASGYNPGPSRPDSTTNPSTAAPATVPSIDTRYQAPQPNQYQQNQYSTPHSAGTSPSNQGQQTERPLAAVGEGANRVRETVRDTVNTIGHGGQQVLDQGRTTLGNLVSPPDDRNYNPQANPLVNLADSARSELRNTTEAVTDTWNRNVVNNSTGLAPTGQPTGQNQPPVNSGQFDNWGSTTSPSPGATTQQPYANQQQPTQYPQDPRQLERYAQERSVLNNNTQGQNPAASASAPILDPPEVDRWGNQQAPVNSNDSVASGLDQGFDQFNRTTSTNTRATVPVQQDNNNGFPSGSSWRDNPASQTDPPQQGQNTVATWDPDANSQPANHGNSQGAHQTSHASHSPSLSNDGEGQTSSRPFGDFAPPEGNASAPTGSDPDTQQQAPASNTGLYALAWAIAVGSVGANLFQWVNIVDLRNKYRVALRRTSPGFGRNTAA